MVRIRRGVEENADTPDAEKSALRTTTARRIRGQELWEQKFPSRTSRN